MEPHILTTVFFSQNGQCSDYIFYKYLLQYCVLPIFSKNHDFREDSFEILRCWTKITTKQSDRTIKKMDRVTQTADGDIPLLSLSDSSACNVSRLE